MSKTDLNLKVHIVKASQNSSGELDYIEEVHFAVDNLEDMNVYASSEATEALQNYEGSEIAVVELPGETIDEWGMTPQEISQDLLDRVPEYKIVVTYVTNTDRFGLATESQEMTIEAYETLLRSESRTAEESLFQEYGELVTMTSTADQDFSDYNRGAIAGGVGAGLGGMLLGGVLIAALGKKITHAATDEKRESKPLQMPEDPIASVKTSDDQFLYFRQLAHIHRKQGYIDSADLMDGILVNLEELFDRMQKTGDHQRRKIAEVEYTDVLSRLNKALSEDYYLDIKRNSKLWSNPKKRLEEVLAALRATDKYVLSNIRDENDLRDIDFRVGLEGILKSTEFVDPKRMMTSSN